MNGNAIAAGVIQALYCDYRIMQKGYYLALNESRISVNLSDTAFNLVKRAVGSTHKAKYVLQTGKNFYAKEALQIGLIDKISKSTNPNEFINECIDILANDYLKSDLNIAKNIKKMANNDISNVIKTDGESRKKRNEAFTAPNVVAFAKRITKRKQAKL